MSIKIYKFEEQTPGGFNNGEILENRPVVLTGEPEDLQPYSNLFYWAHAWSEKGSTIGEHPHRGFEIMSFVLKGSIEHYDTKNKKWIPLKAGDVQIIRSGSGISHSEKINAGSEIFQIWFDPDLNKTFPLPASYSDYPAESFTVNSENGFDVKIFSEDGSNFDMTSPGISIKEISFDKGSYEYEISEGKICSAYLIDGQISIGHMIAVANDFILARNESSLKFEAREKGRLFIIETPEKLEYRTYAERHV
jgi:redox-sensitive bicupin YhaK (pirin superfamily)